MPSGLCLLKASALPPKGPGPPFFAVRRTAEAALLEFIQVAHRFPNGIIHDIPDIIQDILHILNILRSAVPARRTIVTSVKALLPAVPTPIPALTGILAGLRTAVLARAAVPAIPRTKNPSGRLCPPPDQNQEALHTPRNSLPGTLYRLA